jgi:hypothetical protein
MKVAKVQDIANLADGSVIGEMRVQIKAAFPPKVGEGKYGPWRVQSCIVKDATGELRASFWVQDDIQKLVGQTVTLKSQASTKGLQGLNVQYSKHSDANELKVTDKAAIIDDAGAAVASYVSQAQSSVKAAPVATNPTAARKRLFQQAQLYVECIKAAGFIREQIKITDDHFQAVVASMYISADKAGLASCFPDSNKPVEDEIPMEPVKAKDEFEEETGW